MGLFRNDPVDLSDERLMELVTRGQERAFAVLYDRYRRKLLTYFHRMLWQDHERAQDFLQELFTKIAQRPESFRPGRPFRTWLYSVANNMCKNEYRRMAIRTDALPHLKASANHTAQADGGGQVDRDQFNARLGEELDKLDPDHKAAFVMRYEEDLSIKEIAAAFGISEGTVKSRLFYTVRKLAAALPEFDPRPQPTSPATGR
ncbi:MAG: sigma-70 family RNA polymerase sigma factor [Flavobacteriales bacterium]|nr:sigma-70 family RNA polymerase sigma factor [Flavobacteriales bacterium]MEB2341850.1 sigma-70 family RNA polymerase sigma factor [Flavobacteriia bacterium]